MSKLSERLKQRRNQLELTQESLAELIDTSQKQIWKYESGRQVPSALVLGQIADVLDTTTDWLLGRTDNPQRPLRNYDDLDELEQEIFHILRSQKLEDRQKFLNVAKALVS